MCLCAECAQALRLQTNKCPLCRQPVESFLQIKIHTGEPGAEAAASDAAPSESDFAPSDVGGEEKD